MLLLRNVVLVSAASQNWSTSSNPSSSLPIRDSLSFSDFFCILPPCLPRLGAHHAHTQEAASDPQPACARAERPRPCSAFSVVRRAPLRLCRAAVPPHRLATRNVRRRCRFGDQRLTAGVRILAQTLAPARPNDNHVTAPGLRGTTALLSKERFGVTEAVAFLAKGIQQCLRSARLGLTRCSRLPRVAMANKAEHDLQIKILTIGDSSVGKTALLNQFANKQFSNAAIPTIGIGTHQLCPLPVPRPHLSRAACLPGRLWGRVDGTGDGVSTSMVTRALSRRRDELSRPSLSSSALVVSDDHSD